MLSRPLPAVNGGFAQIPLVNFLLLFIWRKHGRFYFSQNEKKSRQKACAHQDVSVDVAVLASAAFGQSISQFGSAMTSDALIVWAYKQEGTVLSISWLSSRANGLQSLSGSFVAVFAPILVTTILSFYSVQAVIVFYLISFAVCFLTLLLFVNIKESRKSVSTGTNIFVYECKEGFQFLHQNKGIMHLMLFMAIINLLAAMVYNSVLPAMMLTRSGGGDAALGIVTACIGTGGIICWILASISKPPKRK